MSAGYPWEACPFLKRKGGRVRGGESGGDERNLEENKGRETAGEMLSKYKFKNQVKT